MSHGDYLINLTTPQPSPLLNTQGSSCSLDLADSLFYN